MIKNIIFDLGNVLVQFKPLEWLTRKYGDDGEFLYREFCLSPLWSDLDLGQRSVAEVKKILCRQFPQRTTLLSDCLDNYFGMLTPLPAGTQLLEKLVSQGLSAFYLTNYHAEAFSHLKQTYPWFSHFKGGVCSAFCGLAKPDPAIYRLLCDRMDLRPEESLFLDDMIENIEAADALGFHTVHVEDPALLGETITLKLV